MYRVVKAISMTKNTESPYSDLTRHIGYVYAASMMRLDARVENVRGFPLGGGRFDLKAFLVVTFAQSGDGITPLGITQASDTRVVAVDTRITSAEIPALDVQLEPGNMTFAVTICTQDFRPSARRIPGAIRQCIAHVKDNVVIGDMEWLAPSDTLPPFCAPQTSQYDVLSGHDIHEKAMPIDIDYEISEWAYDATVCSARFP